ncbi:MAG: VOC family protein [Anaerolineae bacterium]
MTAQVLKIDHVTIAGPALEPLRAAFSNVGLATEYGGPHSNGVTHMALLGFDDGSYIELISTLKAGQTAPWWNRHIQYDGGPCAWAVRVADIAQEGRRIAGLGVPIQGPKYFHRERPDGIRVEWDLVYLGDQQAGAKLPFLIADRTPRDYRVRPTPAVAGSELTGIARVVLGVQALEPALDLFRRLYDWPPPEIEAQGEFGARLANFEGQPVILAEPLRAGNWLDDRLARFDECPCAFLIGSRNLDESGQRPGLERRETWFERRVAWFNEEKLRSIRLGIIGS